MENFNLSIKNVPRQLLLLHAANFCLSEVHDGGLLQFFFNSTGILCPEAISGFSALNMPELAKTLAAAAEHLGTPYPGDRDDRMDKLFEASPLSKQEMETVLKTASNFYLAVVRATEPLGFAALGEEVWHLSNEENGGFQVNAMRYAQEFAEHLEHPLNAN